MHAHECKNKRTQLHTYIDVRGNAARRSNAWPRRPRPGRIDIRRAHAYAALCSIGRELISLVTGFSNSLTDDCR